MVGTAFSLMTAIFFGLDPLFMRKGLLEIPSPFAGAIISLTVNVLFFLILFFITSPSFSGQIGIFYFLLAGLLAPGLARIFAYKGIEKLGASISAPLISTETLFSFLLAIVFLGEEVTPPIIFGAAVIFFGVIILKFGASSQSGIVRRLMSEKKYSAFPLVAAALYGISLILRKMGLDQSQSSILGGMFTSISSWVLLLLIFGRKLVKGGIIHPSNKRGICFFLLSGCCTSFAWLCLFHALSIGKVVIVSPIINSHSLFTIYLSYLFLKNTETVNYKIILGAFCIVLGISLMSAFN